MTQRTIGFAGKAVAVQNVASVHAEAIRQPWYPWGWGIAVVGALFAFGSGGELAMIFFGLLAVVVGAAMVFFGTEFHAVLELNSGRELREVAAQQEIEARVAEIEQRMNAPAATVRTSLSEAAELVQRGLLTRDEWAGIKGQVAGWPHGRYARLRLELKHLDDMRRQGLLSESEFRDRKWDILSRMG